VTFIPFGSETAGPTKLRKGFYGRRCLETGQIVDRRPMPRRQNTTPEITSLAALDTALGEHGPTACFCAETLVIDDWAEAGNGANCRHSATLVKGCTRLLREKAFFDTGLHLPTGKAPISVLDRLEPDMQAETRIVLTEAREDWEAAGSPGVSLVRLKRTYNFFRSAISSTRRMKLANAEGRA
jgi:hypothetical protein